MTPCLRFSGVNFTKTDCEGEGEEGEGEESEGEEGDCEGEEDEAESVEGDCAGKFEEGEGEDGKGEEGEGEEGEGEGEGGEGECEEGEGEGEEGEPEEGEGEEFPSGRPEARIRSTVVHIPTRPKPVTTYCSSTLGGPRRQGHPLQIHPGRRQGRKGQERGSDRWWER